MQPATIELQTPQGSVTIRPTREEDAEDYRELRLEALRSHPTAFGADYAEDLARPIEQWRQSVRDGAGGQQGILYVAEADGALIGMTGVYRHDRAKMRHHGTIWGVYVRPARRGARIADTLIEACLDWSRLLQLRLVKLSVVTSNVSAIRCYVKSGFSVYGLEPEAIYYENVYYDELLMCRHVSES